MRTAPRLLFCSAVVLLALFARPAMAQEAASTVKGRVTDATGNPVAGVEVSARSSVLIGPLTSRTSGSGDYFFPALPPGPYVLGFSRDGLVPIKMSMQLSIGESAVVSVVMHQHNGDGAAMTVASERQVFPPSWVTSLVSRYSSLEQLPITGTARSAVAVSTELAAVRPGWTIFLLDGMPLRNGWKPAAVGSFAGPASESLREVAVNPGRMGPGYGRLQTGAIESVTLRGANNLTGSVRAVFGGGDINADLLRDARSTDGLPTSAEYTAGGSLVRDRAWFFVSGRNLRQSVEDQTLGTAAPFSTSTKERMGLARLTFAPRAGHRLEAQWVGIHQTASDTANPETPVVADAGALASSTIGDRVLSAAYLARAGRFDLAARYTDERGTSEWAPRPEVGRTSLRDQQTGLVWWAPPACAQCDPRTVTHRTLRLTGDTSLATALGNHDLTFGYDLSRSSLVPESAVGGNQFDLRVTRSVVSNGIVYPVIEPGSTWIVWRPDLDRRATVRADALFIGDRWMPGGRLSFDLGLRFDRNRATLSGDGSVVVSENTISPRLYATWRLSERLPWTLAAGFGRYVADATDGAFDDAAGLGTRVFSYQGPALNAGALTFAPADAIDRTLAWFASAGGTSRQAIIAIDPLNYPDALRSTSVDEWSFGVSRMLGSEGSARLDLTRRVFENAVSQSSLFERAYTGVTLKAKYRFGHYADVDAQYTLSTLSGNADGPAGLAGLLSNADLSYPEYFDPSWRMPSGSLPDDARHRLRMWAHTEIIANDSLGLLLLTVMYSRESGRPYGAAGLVSVAPFVSNPGYAVPPAATLYYFTDRDAFRTEPIARTDLGLNYRRRLPGTVHGDIFAAFHILNVTDNAVVLHPERLIRVSTAYTNPALQQFNPFTQSPVLGTHWTLDDSDTRRGTARAGVPTTLPRTFRFTIGIRF